MVEFIKQGNKKSNKIYDSQKFKTTRSLDNALEEQVN